MAAHAHIFYPDIGWRATIALPVGSTASGFPLTNMQDGSMSTTWKAGGTASAATILIDLGSVKDVGAICILGHNLYSARNDSGSTYTDIEIAHSLDAMAWTVVVDSIAEHAMRITSDLPYILTPAVSARYLYITIDDPSGTQSYPYEIAELFIAGSVLSLTEPTSYKWTPHDLKMHSTTSGSDIGMGIPALPGHVTQRVPVEIGKQGIANDFFDDLVKSSAYPAANEAPSFQHFIRTCWSLGGMYVYAPAYDDTTPQWWLRYEHTGGSGTWEAGETLTGGTSGEVVTFAGELLQIDAPICYALVTGWDLGAWSNGEAITGNVSDTIGDFMNIVPANRMPTGHGADGFAGAVERLGSGQQRHWIGATVCRAPANGKIRTPFVESWRRKLQIDQESTAEWTGR